MGMSTGGSKGGATADINVTPLVDICLVLLIIFMVMLPKNVPEISVKVPPESKAKPKPNTDNLVLGLTKDGAVTLNRSPVDKAALKETLENQLQFRDKKVIFVNFDDDSNYGIAVEILDVAKRAGADVLGIMKNKDKPTPNSLRPGAAS